MTSKNKITPIEDSQDDKNGTGKAVLAKAAKGTKIAEDSSDTEEVVEVVEGWDCVESTPYCADILKILKCMFCCCMKVADKKLNGDEDEEDKEDKPKVTKGK